jgi:hypothetical protein
LILVPEINYCDNNICFQTQGETVPESGEDW